MMFRGCAVANGASPNFAYMSLARYVDDATGRTADGAVINECGQGCYLTIRNGMKLRWEQYNATKCTTTIDLELRNANGQWWSLRDSGLTDNFGVSVHPDDRTCFAGWRSIEVDLSPLAGWTIMRWMVAFDDPDASGTWRSYFDNVRVVY
jgi:hypothetical protein